MERLATEFPSEETDCDEVFAEPHGLDAAAPQFTDVAGGGGWKADMDWVFVL